MSPTSVSISLEDLWTPHPTQQAFLDAIRDCPDLGMVAYVGALGSGKSWALCRAAIGLSLKYPGIAGVIGRFLSTDLRDTTQKTFFGMIAEVENRLAELTGEPTSLGTFQATRNNYRFTCGSEVLFRPLDDAEIKYKSLEVAYVGIDEASEVTQEGALMLMSRRRQRGFPHVGFVVSNPTGRSHWLYKWFVADKTFDYTIFRTNSTENAPFLPPGYIDNLRRRYPPDWVRRYLDGEWGDLEDARPVFPLFDRAVHVRDVAALRAVPVLVGVDFGFQRPGVVWAQLDPFGQLRIVRSWAPREHTTLQLIEGIRLRNQEWFPKHNFQYFAGHDGRTQKDTGDKTDEQLFAQAGMRPTIRYYRVNRGLDIVRELLDIRVGRDQTEPGLLVDPFNERMIEGFEGAYRLKDDEDKPEKTGLYDPLFDALRYIVVNTLSPAGRPPIREPIPLFRRPRRG